MNLTGELSEEKVVGVSEATSRRQVNRRLSMLCKGYTPSLPIAQIGAILRSHGFLSEPLEGIYCGHEGKVHEQVGKSTWIRVTWYMHVTGNYEVLAYVS